MSVDEKAQVLQKVESSPGSKRKVLAGLGVSKNDCYRWRARHGQGSLEMKMAAGKGGPHQGHSPSSDVGE